MDEYLVKQRNKLNTTFNQISKCTLGKCKNLLQKVYKKSDVQLVFLFCGTVSIVILAEINLQDSATGIVHRVYLLFVNVTFTFHALSEDRFYHSITFIECICILILRRVYIEGQLRTRTTTSVLEYTKCTSCVLSCMTSGFMLQIVCGVWVRSRLEFECCDHIFKRFIIST